jgi:hypothetical protein
MTRKNKINGFSLSSDGSHRHEHEVVKRDVKVEMAYRTRLLLSFKYRS